MKLIHTTETKRFYLLPDRGMVQIMIDWYSPSGEIEYTSFHSECRNSEKKSVQARNIVNELAHTLRAEY